MRVNLLLILICISLNSYSQDENLLAFRAHIPKDLGTEITMPDPGLGDFNLEQFQRSSGSINIMAIASDSLFHKIFSRYHYNKDSLNNFKGDKNDWQYKMMLEYMADSLPKVDFSRYNLVLYSACGQCMAHCHHDKGNPSCHRNACDYQYAWFLREKSQDRIGEQVIMK